MPAETETTIKPMVLDYLLRDPATTRNVASHFGMPLTKARDILSEMQREGLVRMVPNYSWAAVQNG